MMKIMMVERQPPPHFQAAAPAWHPRNPDCPFVADEFQGAVASPDFGARFAAFVCSSNEQREESLIMSRGDKGKYTDKQKRKAEHIEEGYEDRGVSKKEAKARGSATVNKESGGGKKSGSGRGKKESHVRVRIRTRARVLAGSHA
jgi:plasmid stabilization system protein ParE